MAAGILRWLLSGAVLQLAFAKKSPGKVLDLHDHSFNKTIHKHDRVLLQVYASCLVGPQGESAPWCTTAKEWEGALQEAADILKGRRRSSKVARINVAEESQARKRFKINMEPMREEDVPKLPTLHYYVRGKYWSLYKGSPDGAQIADWLSQREVQDVSWLDESEVDAYLNASDGGGRLTVLGRVKAKSPRADTFWNLVEGEFLGSEFFDFRLAAVRLPATADANRDASLSLVRPNFPPPEARTVKYSGAWSGVEMSKWLMKKSYPTVALAYDAKRYSPSVLSKVGFEGVVVGVLDARREALASQAVVQEWFRANAKKHSSWIFVVADIGSLDTTASASLGLGPEITVPAVIAVAERRRYLLPSVAGQALSEDSVRRFLDDIKNKRAEPHFRSAVVPDPEIDGQGIVTLVGKTFEAHVFDENFDVLVLFTAPDCQRCRVEAESLLEALADRAAQANWLSLGLRLARMDVTDNDCREEVTALPKMVLYPAVASSRKMELRHVFPQKYELKLMAAFLKEHARNLAGVKREL